MHGYARVKSVNLLAKNAVVCYTLTMEEYLNRTIMLNYKDKLIKKLLERRGWAKLSEYERVGAIYDYVQNEIPLGYNVNDMRTAAEVVRDGYGQCNTKATLLMTLLRAVGIPCRLHGAFVTKKFQRSLMPKLMFKLAPPRIVHTWAEVLLNDKWLSLEGVICDKRYLEGLKRKFEKAEGKFFDYAVAVEDFNDMKVDWCGADTAVQQVAVTRDLGTFETPDEFFKIYKQEYKGLKKLLYEKIGRRIMNRRVKKIRKIKK